jgi:hypothetical protein
MVIGVKTGVGVDSTTASATASTVLLLAVR